MSTMLFAAFGLMLAVVVENKIVWAVVLMSFLGLLVIFGKKRPRRAQNN